MDGTQRGLRVAAAALAGAMAVFSAGCGFITDKDRIKIAKIDDTYITRGDLFKVIREMPDDERPIVRNKSDMLRVLDGIIDERIKGPLVQAIQAEHDGKELVPRQAAMQRFFQEHAEDNYAALYACENAEAAGMSDAELEMLKQEMDIRIDRAHDRLSGEAAVAFRAVEAVKNGTLTATDAEYEQEYRLRKDELKTLEWMKFRAFRFPEHLPEAPARAAQVRQRLDSGESSEALAKEYAAENPDFVFESEIENNPNLEKFRGFWLNASGSGKGDIFGPVFLPAYQLMGSPDAEGRTPVINMPAAYLVVEVLDHRPEEPLTLEQAKPQLAPYVLVAKMMDQLREQHGVEIYTDKLPDPAMFSQQFGKPGSM